MAGATEGERARHEALRKPPLVLEADEAVVLKAWKPAWRQRMLQARSRRPNCSMSESEWRRVGKYQAKSCNKRANPTASACHQREPGARLRCGRRGVGDGLTIEARCSVRAGEGHAELTIAATGRDAERCCAYREQPDLRDLSRGAEGQGRKLLPLDLRIHNEIPLGVGCGSSAAARLGGVMLANHFGGLGWSMRSAWRRLRGGRAIPTM